VSFANHAAVREFETEEPTTKLQFSAQTEAELHGSFIHDSPNPNPSILSHPSHPPALPTPATVAAAAAATSSRQQRFPSIVSSVASSNDDEFLHYVTQQSPHSHPHTHPHRPLAVHADYVAMEIEQADDEQDMDLTDNIQYTAHSNLNTLQQEKQQHRASVTPQIDDLENLYNDEDDTESLVYHASSSGPNNQPHALQTIHATPPMENVQDLLNYDEDEDTITSNVAPPLIPPNASQSHQQQPRGIPLEARNVSPNSHRLSLMEETAHLQHEEDKQSTSEFNYRVESNTERQASGSQQSSSPMRIDQDNHGSFNQDAEHEAPPPHDAAMPALEAEQEINTNSNAAANNKNSAEQQVLLSTPPKADVIASRDSNHNHNQQHDVQAMTLSMNRNNVSDVQPTGVISYGFPSLPNHDASELEQHTLSLHLPANLMQSPQKTFHRRRSSMMTDGYGTPNVPLIGAASMEESSNLESSMLSETGNLGSATKVFRVDVREHIAEEAEQQQPSHDHVEAVANAEDDDEHNTSLNTMMKNIGNVLNEQYGLAAQNQLDGVNPDELRIVALDGDAIRDRQSNYLYHMQLPPPKDNDNQMEVEDSSKERAEEQQEEAEEEEKEAVDAATTINWREIVKKYELFPESKTAPRYSLGIGMKARSDEMDRILRDPQDIVLQQICDLTELQHLQRFEQEIDGELDNVHQETQRLERQMDARYAESALIQKIVRCDGQQQKEQEMRSKWEALKDFCKLKCDTKFLQKREEVQEHINHDLITKYSALCKDLDKLKRIYTDLNQRCNEQQEINQKLRQFESNQTLKKLQNEIFENEEKMRNEEQKKQKYSQLVTQQQSDNEEMEKDIDSYSEKLNDLQSQLEEASKYEMQIEEVAATISYLRGVTGIRLNKVTSSKLQMFLLRQVAFSLDYDYQSKQVYNVQFAKHPSPTLKDSFSVYLINMLHAIGHKLDLVNRLRTLTDLKPVIWDIVELMKGIVEIRTGLDEIGQLLLKQQTPYLLLVHAVDNDKKALPFSNESELEKKERITILLTIGRDVEYQLPQKATTSMVSAVKMRSRMLIDCVFPFKLGYPHNKIEPIVSVNLIREVFDEESRSYGRLKSRIEQMFVEHKLNEILEHKLSSMKPGNGLFARCVNLLATELDAALQNEANGKHQPGVYDEQ